MSKPTDAKLIKELRLKLEKAEAELAKLKAHLAESIEIRGS